nr:protein mitoshell isoform X2 [Drosophila kikkawai]
MNIPIYQVPPMATQSMRQQSLYQQTYLDRNRMITDVFVQEHVSQTTWAWAPPPPPPPPTALLFPGGMTHQPAPAPAAAPIAAHLGHMAYVPMPNVQYYAASSASMNAYGQGQVYSARASTSTAGYYAPPYYNGGSSSNGIGGAAVLLPNKPATSSSATQSQAQTPSPTKRTCDVATQADLLPDEGSEMETLPASDEEKNLDSSDSSFDNCGAGDGFRVHSSTKRNSEVMLHQQLLHDITTISLQGCEIAERVASVHRNRPCFKKIDTLCGRLKQDLLRPDGVLANINSQGIAWAVKDFIFVFTRIVNAWVIMKGYVYNTPDGLNKIKDELPSGFMATFDSWQNETLALVEMIIKSFVNLDDLLLKQKNSFVSKDLSLNNASSIWSFNDSNESTASCKKNNCIIAGQGLGPAASSSPILPIGGAGGGAGFKTFPESEEQRVASTKSSALYKPKSGVSLNYLYTMIEDSEETQRNVDANGTYLKTGTYQPLQKEMLKQIEMPQARHQHREQPIETQWPWQGAPSATPAAAQGIRQGTCRKHLDRHTDARGCINPFSLIKRDVTRQLYELSTGIMELQNLDHFFQKQFTRNYYPEFFHRCQDDFIDIRAIVLQCESASYNHLYHAIHDLRRINFVVRCYLQIKEPAKSRYQYEWAI